MKTALSSSTKTTELPAPAAASYPAFTLLQEGKPIPRNKKYLREMWIRAAIPRLGKAHYLNPEITEPIFEDVYAHHAGVRKLLGADVRSWSISLSVLEALRPLITFALAQNVCFPSPWHLAQLLLKLKKGNPTPAIDPILADLHKTFGEDLPKDPKALNPIPSFLLENRLGKSTFLSFIENNPETIRIPATPDEAVLCVYLGLLLEFYSKTLGNITAIIDSLLAKARTNQLEMRISIEPHAFLSLGHHPGCDDSACFGADSSNGAYPILLAAQDESIVMQLGYRDDSTFKVMTRAWGRLHADGIMLSNFYPKASHGSTLGAILILAGSHSDPKNLPPYDLTRKALYAPTATPKDDPCLWIPKGHTKSPLYHNGDAMWWPLPEGQTVPPAISGRVPSFYASVPWKSGFPFAPATE